MLLSVEPYDGMFSSDDEDIHNNPMVASESEDEGIYPFRRNRNCDYYKVSSFRVHYPLHCKQLLTIFYFSLILKALVIGPGSLLEKMELRILNTVTTLHPCVFQSMFINPNPEKYFVILNHKFYPL